MSKYVHIGEQGQKNWQDYNMFIFILIASIVTAGLLIKIIDTMQEIEQISIELSARQQMRR